LIIRGFCFYRAY